MLQIELGIPEAEIAIITPYQAQVAHIADLLREDHPDLIIGSVDGMQGQEREVGLAMSAIGPHGMLTC
jgi:DNA polymerase alpha-associated DNA helicase A